MRCLCSLVGWALLFATASAQERTNLSATKTVLLLTIGNSFSQDATFFLDELATADRNKLVIKTAVVGGSPLSLHWDKSQANQKDPADKNGHYGGARGLKEILKDGPHDFVTIQQRSLSSHDVATYRPYAAQLKDYVKQHAPEATLLLHETWAYRVDDPRFKVAKPKEGEPKTQREMYEMLREAYRTIAKELNIKLIPVGDAFMAADSDERWGFKPDASFNSKEAKSPALPDQAHSLHVGYNWNKNADGEPTLSMDGHHASTAGRYLGACVWYEILFKTSCVGNQFTAGLDAEYAKFLQATAHQAVAQNRDGAELRK